MKNYSKTFVTAEVELIKEIGKAPDGWQLGEYGNICDDGKALILTSTVYPTSGQNPWKTVYWATPYDLKNWSTPQDVKVYAAGNKLRMTEDADLMFHNGEYWMLFEDKDADVNNPVPLKHLVSIAKGASLDKMYYHSSYIDANKCPLRWNGDASKYPHVTMHHKPQAIYSASFIKDNGKLYLFYDLRFMGGPPSAESIGLCEVIGNEFKNHKEIITWEDYPNMQNSGGTQIHKVNGKYIMKGGGIEGWDFQRDEYSNKYANKTWDWFNCFYEADNIYGPYKMIWRGKIKDQHGDKVGTIPFYHNDEPYYIATKNNKLYLAKPKGNVSPPNPNPIDMTKEEFNPIKDHSKTAVVKVSGKHLYENGNILYEPDDTGKEYKMIINEHPKTGDKGHGTEKLTYVWSSDKKNWKGYKPILRNFKGGDGLEDPFLIKAGSNYILACEHKPVGQSAVDTVLFKGTDIINLQYVKSISPKYNWDAHSIMSPTLYVEGNEIYLFYEGRPLSPSGWEGLQRFQVGLIKYDFNLNVKTRYSNPVVNGYTIFDDINKIGEYYYAMTHDWKESRPDDSRWRGQIWRSKNLTGGWSKWADVRADDCYPMPQMLVDDKINLFYSRFTVFEGIRLAYPKKSSTPDPDPDPTPGGDMKIKLEGTLLSVVDPEANKKYAWNVRYVDNKTEWLAFGETYEIPTGKQKDGNQFWCYPMDDSHNLSNIIVYKTGEPEPIRGCTDPNALNYDPEATEDDGSCIYDVPPEPGSNDAIVTEIRAHLVNIDNASEAIKDLLDDIK